MSQEERPATVRVPAAAGRIGIHPQTLYGLIRQGRSPVPVIRIGKSILIPEAALERFIATGEQVAS